MNTYFVAAVVCVWMNLNLCKGFTFDLCPYLINGGTCEPTCQFVASHRWGIPLCVHGINSCCIPPALMIRRRPPTPNTTTTSTTTMSMPTNSNICGRGRPHSRVRRVIGGRRAPERSWPWQVAIRHFTGRYLCGGVIIAHRWILTAAHCFQDTTDVQHLRVYVGHQSLPYGSNVLGRSRNINRIIQHEDFQPNVPENVTDPQTGRTSTIQRHHHDLALIELVDALVFTNSLRPVCLPEQEDNLETNDCWVSGWGETSIQSDDVNEHLQEVSGVMESARTCSQRWGANFTDGIVCFSSGGSGPCKGDSGGGMTCTQGDDRSVLTGIISWGRDDCVHDEHPSVLTRVGAYLPWIHNHIDL